MQNHFQKDGERLIRLRIVSTGQESKSASATAVDPLALPIRGNSPENLDDEKPGYSGWFKPVAVPPKRLPSTKVDPDYKSRASLHGIGSMSMQTRSQLKKDQVLKVVRIEAPARNGPRAQKPEPPKKPNVWHLSNVCHHSMRQICNPATRQAVANDVGRWRAIESICFGLRGIDVEGNMGILTGPVSFEDIFQVLGLDEQGEPPVDPPPPEVTMESPAMEVPVSKTEVCMPPPQHPVLRGRVRERPTKVQGLEGEPKVLSKSPRGTKRSSSRMTSKKQAG